MRQSAFVALLSGATALASHYAEGKFPLQLSENRRHLVDQRGHAMDALRETHRIGSGTDSRGDGFERIPARFCRLK